MKQKYPAEWLEQVPAVIFGSLRAGEIRILLHPGQGLADGNPVIRELYSVLLVRDT